jgi:uncharacterized YccA/Bax inhibitor family protein
VPLALIVVALVLFAGFTTRLLGVLGVLAILFALADALCWLLAARQFILDVHELETKGPSNPNLAEALPRIAQRTQPPPAG